MGLYTRRQLALLLLLVGASGVGLAVRHWRATHPELVGRLEQIDRESPAADEGTAHSPAARRTEPRPPARQSSTDRPQARTPKLGATGDDQHHAPLDLNRATLVELTRLPGIGPVLARRILETREASGRFAAVDDLVTVRGLGRSRLERLRPLVSVPE